ncbi:hypothetical protein D5266_09775, partial [bacterium c-19]|nr:hypothetical protein [bacterium c-19]
FELPKGSKVILGKYNNKEIVWDIGNNDSNGNYVLMSSKPIVDSIATYESSVPVTTTPQSIANRESYCLRYNNGSSNYAIQFCPVTPLKNEIAKIQTNNSEATIITTAPVLPSINDVRTGGVFGLSLNDRAYKSAVTYWLDGYITSPTDSGGQYRNTYNNAVQWPLSLASASYDFIDMTTGNSISRNEKIAWANSRNWVSSGANIVKFAIRPFALIDKTKIMFAADTSFTDKNWHSYIIDTANLNANNELNPNKLRVQSSLTASLQDIKRNSQSTSKVMKNGSVDLTVTANTGTNAQISVIIYNETGADIQYYKMLEDTKSGTSNYTLDLATIPIGKYQVAVINEEYNNSSDSPVESSSISNLMPLEIVEPHKVTYTKAPQSGATSGKDYEFSKNVNVGQAVGKITVNPQGVMPLT